MAPDPRTRDLKLLHVAKRQLGLDQDTWRALCQRLGGVNSSADLTPLGRARLLKELKAKGFVITPRGGAKPQLAADKQGMIDKIEALLAEKRRLEGQAQVPWAYADAIARRLAKVDAVRFADVIGLRKILAALAIHVRRLQDQHPPQEA